MKRIPIALLLVSVMTAVLSSTPLLAQRTKPTPHPERLAPEPLGRCLAVLDLTDAQKAGIRAAVETAQPALRTLNEQSRTDREALKNALAAVSPEACIVGAALLKVRTDEAAIKAEMARLQSTIEALLMPEQKAKLAGCLEGRGRSPRPAK